MTEKQIEFPTDPINEAPPNVEEQPELPFEGPIRTLEARPEDETVPFAPGGAFVEAQKPAQD